MYQIRNYMVDGRAHFTCKCRAEGAWSAYRAIQLYSLNIDLYLQIYRLLPNGFYVDVSIPT